jgi:inner membrane protein
MNVIEHFFIGWCIANTSRDPGRRERVLITAAAVIPDVDGLGMLVEIPTRNTSHPLLWWTEYHHILAHNIGAAIIVTAAAYFIARQQRWLTALLAFIAFHSHIVGDIIGARGPDGYQWPIPYFLPFARYPELSWKGQWALNAWPNFVITAIALAITFRLAWSRGHSPLEMFSARADEIFVSTLRARFTRRASAAGSRTDDVPRA